MHIVAKTLVMLLCVNMIQVHPTSEDNYNALPPVGYTIFCLHNPQDCKSIATGATFESRRSDRWNDLIRINSAVNAEITPIVENGITDGWKISPAKGNCTDYAVTKRHLLLQLGWPSSALLLAEVAIRSTGEHHLILIARGSRGDWILDNLKSEIEPVAKSLEDYAFARAESQDDPKLWTTRMPGRFFDKRHARDGGGLPLT